MTSPLRSPPLTGRVAHVPAWNDPYQQHLIEALREYGIDANLEYGVARFGIDLTVVAGLLRGPIREALHIHWQHPYLVRRTLVGSVLSASMFTMQLAIARLAGVRIVWTIHNLKNHENRYARFERFFCGLIARLAHKIIVHCEAASAQAEAWLGHPSAQKFVVIPHGGFAELMLDSPGRTQARHELGLSESTFVFLHMGLIRPYKGIEELLEAFGRISQEERILIIAGGCKDPTLEASLSAKAQGLNVIRIPRFITPQEVQRLMAAADVVVCPYRDILTSGGVITAMSHRKPVVSPRLGCIPEVLTEEGGFLYSPNEPEELERALRAALASERDDLEARGRRNFETCVNLDWSAIAEETATLYAFNSKAVRLA